MKRNPRYPKTALWMAALILWGLSGCNLPSSQASITPTMDVTQAYQTVEARLTQAVALTPTIATPSATESGVTTQPPTAPAATITSPPSPTALRSATPQSMCDLAAPGNPIDVTVPDDTIMQPNQAFTKVWRLQNVGTCTWTRNYAVTFFSGEQMGAPASVALPGNVAPGQSVDISVDMVAPAAPGKYQGNWKLRNAANVLFGIGPNGSAPFWVRIIVAVTPTIATTLTPSATSSLPTQTATPTPVVRVSGSASLVPGDHIDLDTNQLNGGSADLLYETNSSNQHQFTPQGSAILGLYGNTQPGPANCQATSMTTLPLIIENTPIVSYLCYRTDQGLYGFIRLNSFNAANESVGIDLVTWAAPSP